MEWSVDVGWKHCAYVCGIEQQSGMCEVDVDQHVREGDRSSEQRTSLSLSLSLRRSIYHGRLKNISLLSTLNDHSLVSLSLSSRLRPFVRWVRLHRDVLVISFAIGYNANDAERIQRTALGGMEWFCGESGDAGETAEGLERTSSRDSRTAGRGTTQLSLLSFSPSLTHEDDDEDSRWMSSFFALFISKETETERARARRTIRDSLARFHRLHLTLSLS